MSGEEKIVWKQEGGGSGRGKLSTGFPLTVTLRVPTLPHAWGRGVAVERWRFFLFALGKKGVAMAAEHLSSPP